MKMAKTAAVHLDQLIYLKHLALRYLSDTMSPCQHRDASKNQDTCIVILYLGVS